MKKVVLSLAVLFSVAMVACNSNKTAEAVDSDTIVTEEVAEGIDSNNETVTVAEGTETVAGETVAQAEAVEAN